MKQNLIQRPVKLRTYGIHNFEMTLWRPTQRMPADLQRILQRTDLICKNSSVCLCLSVSVSLSLSLYLCFAYMYTRNHAAICPNVSDKQHFGAFGAFGANVGFFFSCLDGKTSTPSSSLPLYHLQRSSFTSWVIRFKISRPPTLCPSVVCFTSTMRTEGETWCDYSAF